MELTFEKLDSAACPRLASVFPNCAPEGFIRLQPCNLFINQHYVDYAQEIKNLSVRHDDIWLVSFPKCGTTWTQEMVWLLTNDLDYDGAKTPLTERFPFLEYWEAALVPKSWWTSFKTQHPDISLDDALATPSKVEGLPSPRFIKTHLPFSCLPDKLLDTGKVIYVTRNPKDAAISWYFHHQLDPILENHLTLEQFVEMFIKDEVLYAPFWNNVMEAWQRRTHHNMLFLFYEDLNEDLPSEIRKVAKFLGKEISNEQLAQLAEHLSFDNFKKNPAVNFENVQAIGLFKKEGSFMRQGQSGSWRKHFDDITNAAFDTWARDHLKNTDLVFKNLF